MAPGASTCTAEQDCFNGLCVPHRTTVSCSPACNADAGEKCNECQKNKRTEACRSKQPTQPQLSILTPTLIAALCSHLLLCLLCVCSDFGRCEAGMMPPQCTNCDPSANRCLPPIYPGLPPVCQPIGTSCTTSDTCTAGNPDTRCMMGSADTTEPRACTRRMHRAHAQAS